MAGYNRWLDRKEFIKKVRAGDTDWKKSCLKVFTGIRFINALLERKAKEHKKRNKRRVFSGDIQTIERDTKV